MATYFTWHNSYQKRSEELMPRRLKSGVQKLIYNPNDRVPHLDIYVTRTDAEKLDESMASITHDVRIALPKAKIELKDSHRDTCYVSVEHITREEVRRLVACLCEQAWINPSVLEEMHRDFIAYDRRVSGGGPAL